LDLPPEERSCSTGRSTNPEADYRERLAELVALLELGDVLTKPVRQLSLGERIEGESCVACCIARRSCFWMSRPWGST